MPIYGSYIQKGNYPEMSDTTEIMRKLVLPCIATRQMVVFPGTQVNLNVARVQSKRACEVAASEDNYLFVVCQKDPTVQTPSQEDCYSVGTIVKITQFVKSQGNNFHIVVEPIARAYAEEIVPDAKNKYLVATVMEGAVEVDGYGGIEGEALVRDVRRVMGDFMKLMPKFFVIVCVKSGESTIKQVLHISL